jgi:hypothetical protein
MAATLPIGGRWRIGIGGWMSGDGDREIGIGIDRKREIGGSGSGDEDREIKIGRSRSGDEDRSMGQDRRSRSPDADLPIRIH